jgi:hypothetical protein
MSKFCHVLKAFAVVIFTLMVTSLAQAQATRTWVSGVGDDANPCSRTAPCKTFAGAISKTADGGEIDAIDPGGFGAVTITKGITIDGGGTFTSILASLTTGVIINDATNTKVITLRNLSINGAGNGVDGIRMIGGKELHVENVDISGFTGDGIKLNFAAGPEGGTFAYFDNVDIMKVTGASSAGIRLASNTFVAAVMDRVRVEKVAIGVQVGATCVATIRDSLFTLGTTGVEMVGASQSIIENSMLTSNTTGLIAGAGSISRLSQVTIMLNTNDFTGTGSVRSSGNNRIFDNKNVNIVPLTTIPK